MKQLRQMLFLGLAGLLCAGCWPMRLTARPGASGTVLDAQTHAPIRSAKVFVARTRYENSAPMTLESALTNARSRVVMTDRAGRFSVSRAHEWITFLGFPGMPALGPATGMLVVQRTGYEPALIPVVTMSGPRYASGLEYPSTENVGTVLLKPAGK